MNIPPKTTCITLFVYQFPLFWRAFHRFKDRLSNLAVVTEVAIYFSPHRQWVYTPHLSNSWVDFNEIIVACFLPRWRRCCTCLWSCLCSVWAQEKREPVCWLLSHCWTAMLWRAVISPCNTTSTMWAPGQDCSECTWILSCSYYQIVNCLCVTQVLDM